MVTLQQDIFRPIYEIKAFFVWLAATFLLIVLQVPAWYLFIIPCIVFAIYRYRQSLYSLKMRMAISAQQLKKIPQDDMVEIGQKAIKQNAFYLGTGFIWGQPECELAYKISEMPPDDINFIPKWLPKYVKDAITPKDTIPDKNAKGMSWIHGIGVSKEEDLHLQFTTIEGNVGIAGTTGAGKTRLYAVLTSQILQTDSCLIVIDPKGDKELKELVQNFARKFKKDFLFFHPAFPSQSVRFNPIKNWNVIADVGARLANLISADGGDSFTRFCELSVNRVCYGLELIGMRPSLKNIRRFVEIGVDQLFTECMNKICTPAFGSDWDAKIGVYMSKNQRLTRSEAMAEFYMQEYAPKFGNNEVMDGLYATLYHNKEHYSKMILSLTPLLQTLCMGELGKLLSPDYEDLEDTREIHNMESVVLGKKVLYIGLDSLSNLTISKTLASTFMAELATVAGTIYNHQKGKPIDTYLIIDEVAEVASEQLLQMLNKARGAGFKIIMAFQSVADFAAKLGSTAKAQQFLDNMNTLLSLRVKLDTAKYISESFGETTVRTMNTSISSGSESESHALEFRASVSKGLKDTRVPLVSPDVLTNLPNLQFFIKMGDGFVRKGRIPIVI